MNKVVLTGRFTKDPEIKYSGETSIAKFTLAVNRKGKDKGADFISCVAFGKTSEFIEKWFSKGMKADVSGRIQTGSYDHKDGYKVYTTDVVVEDIEFGESKNATQESKPIETPANTPAEAPADDGFMNVPDDIDELPFA